MSKVIYTKFNSTRKTEFQLKTSIVDGDDGRYVVKSPLNKKAQKHLDTIGVNYNRLKDYYKDIKPVPYEACEEGIAFPFVEGKTFMSDIDFENDDINLIKEKIANDLKEILNINQIYEKDFEITSEFKSIFPGCNPKEEKAYSRANVDSTLSNFIRTDDAIWCIDYEWIFDFDIPVKYIVYRCLFYLYMEHIDELKKKIGLNDFLSGFEIGDLELYEKMETCFQEYVHGEKRRYIYTKNYLKRMDSFEYLLDKERETVELTKEIGLKENHIVNLEKKITELTKEIELKENHIANIEEQNLQLKTIAERCNYDIEIKDRHIGKLHRMIKNPLYAAYVAGNKVKERVEDKTGKHVQNEKIRVAYKEKYKSVIEAPNDDYDMLIKKRESQESYDEKFDYNPKISVIVPVYNVLDKHLIPCIESVIDQIYTNWELCLADDCSTWDSVRETLHRYENNEKIKIVYRKENGHISLCSNSALEVATGEYIAFLDCDDVLRPNALYEMVKVLNKDPDLDFIYSDEDKIYDDGGTRHMPHFKPDWSPDTMMSHMYTCHFGLYRKSIADEIGGLRQGFEGAQDYDFVLRFTEKTNKIAHIAKILYHWRERAESTSGNADAKPYVIEAARKSKEEALERRGLVAELEYVDIMHQFLVNYKCTTNPKISIIIPSKDNYKILERCVKTLVDLTSYQNYEIIIVDNGSNDENKSKYAELCKKNSAKYIYEKMEFNFSKMCNLGVQKASGEYYLFLNDDIEIINNEWLERMLGQAMLPHSGAVGAKLLYPNSTKIQHDGIINIENGPCHAFLGYDDKNIYYFGRNRLTYNYVAVTAACLLIRADKFNQIGGFDEDLRVAYNDVDLCFKLVEAGYYNTVRNDVILYHHESLSRGDDTANKEKMERLMREQARLYEKHKKLAKYDPFYNINLTQNAIDFSLNRSNSEVLCNEVKKSMKEYKLSGSIIGNVDDAIAGEYIMLKGWFINSDSNKNNEATRRLILENNTGAYVISTTPEYRNDVGDAMPERPDVDFCGFVCNIKKEHINKGMYNVYFVWNNQKWFSGTQIRV